ncbi:response regulator [Desulfomicrobium baculatum]|uniref:Response regulator receiver modulated metal dependent phosphohydrolase n=1 Tax=Desulfomicrobium baculatum (strain DSM 4028 / VKM B-1378 / X) TaxID=525897 RepID=C7LWC5_DESBD|nr:response regulator [Desulfomicrobium baculatum]ACU88617.1 response regulator receiver modulated metal dependent phosphohydrolase [Desulfomicrobium baculatum DSM 4028]
MKSEHAMEEVHFADETPPQKSESDGLWKVMIVDDDDFVHKVTELTLGDYHYQNAPVRYLHAYSGAEARALLLEHPDTAVILLDVVMETENAGLEFARHVRQEANNSFVRIILRTGQPGQAPERKVITEYDINDYKHKAELSEQRLFTAITAAIRSYRDLRTIELGRLGLQEVICASAALFAAASVQDFFVLALEHILRIGRCVGPCCFENGLVALSADGQFEILESRGLPPGAGVPTARLQELYERAAREGRVLVLDQEFAARFFNSHTDQNFFFYVSFGRPLSETAQGLLHILGGNIAVALSNLFLTEEIVATQREVVLTLGEVVETRSKETAHHVKRVAEYSYVLGIKAGLSEERAHLLRMASPMHDVGKIGIPDSILFKPGKLTDEEFSIIKTHTVIGHSILKGSPRRIMRTAATIALQHHEHWDGGGYPHGLIEDETHIFGRITALADVFDALSCDRVYKKAWPLSEVLDYLREKRGRQFDPLLVDIFLENLDEIMAIRVMYPD